MDDEARLDDVPFIAGGVGITPVLGQLGKLDLSRFRLYWTIRFEDLDLVMDTLKRYPTLGPRTRLYFTNVPQSADPDKRSKMEHLNGVASAVHSRRLQESDLTNVRAKTWYICAGKELRTALLRWLNGQTVVFESFDY
jgi:predicted ferric reductase